MHDWIQTHGFEDLIFAGLFSLIMSVAPDPPKAWGFWKMWAYAAAKALGANAGKFVAAEEPAAKQILQVQTQQTPEGGKIVTETAASSTPTSPPEPDPNPKA